MPSPSVGPGPSAGPRPRVRPTSPYVTITSGALHEQDSHQRSCRRLRRNARALAIRRSDPGTGVDLVLTAVAAARSDRAVVVRARDAGGRGCGRGARHRLLLGLAAVSEVAALDAITDAVEAGAGLPEVV